MNSGSIHAEPLGTGHNIFVSSSHTFGTDAFLLAGFSSPHCGERAVDLGTGCGIIPALWLQEGLAASVLGVELQPEACELARMTSSENGWNSRFTVLCADLRTFGAKPSPLRGDNMCPPVQVAPSDEIYFDSLSSVSRESFDLVACNPPYFTGFSGFVSPDRQRAQARSELNCSAADVCTAARFLLRYGGRLCMCHRPERLPDIICAMRDAGLEPKRLQTVHHSPGRAPWLVLIEAKRGGKPSLEMLPPFVMHTDDGADSPQLAALYQHYRTTRGSVK